MTLAAVLALAFAVSDPAPERPAASVAGEQEREFAKLSPFEAIRWSGDAPQVRVGGRWYGLAAIDEIETGRILEHCRAKHGSRAVKRFEEDLVEVLASLGIEPKTTCDLDLVGLEDGKAVRLEAVAMTKANRDAIWREAEARRKKEEAARQGTDEVPRVSREHASEAPADCEDIGCRSSGAAEEVIPAEAAAADLDALEWIVENRFSYRSLRSPDYRGAFDAVRLAARAGVTRRDFAIDLAKALARFGDGHAGVEGLSGMLGPPYLPCLVENAGEALFAVRTDRSGFVDEKRPRLLAIDGVPVETWLEAAAATETRGSDALVRRRATRNLRHVGFLRDELACRGIERKVRDEGKVELTLAALDGRSKRAIVLDVSSQRPIYGQRVRGTHRMLEDGVGYLRLESMDDDPAFLAGLDEAMKSFRDTRALVIDVRGNGGGSRAALLRLFPYFMAADEGPWIANVAAYRLPPGEPTPADGFLADRWLYPATSPRWTPEERAAIERFAATFEPSWRPDPREFSAWHYLVLRRSDNSEAFPYAKPVAILLDSDCFSATDVFLAAFSGRPNVTLVGAPSGGGSGRARDSALPGSGLTVRLSTMASFRRDGRPIDLAGIEPDVAAEPAGTDFTGATDAQLAEALARLR